MSCNAVDVIYIWWDCMGVSRNNVPSPGCGPWRYVVRVCFGGLFFFRVEHPSLTYSSKGQKNTQPIASHCHIFFDKGDREPIMQLINYINARNECQSLLRPNMISALLVAVGYPHLSEEGNAWAQGNWLEQPTSGQLLQSLAYKQGASSASSSTSLLHM